MARNPDSPKKIFQVLGPGLITGASDDDPSGIGTYSQVGAQFGYGMLWTVLFTYPLMSAIQEIAARIGRTTERGLAGNLKRHYPAWFSYPLVALLFMANVLNAGADLGAMGASMKLLIGGPPLLYDVFFAAVCFCGAAFMNYKRYSKLLKWLSLVLFAYVATTFSVKLDWGEALIHTIKPALSFDSNYLSALVAVLGTTISPYLFFWQASEEAEEAREKHKPPLTRAPQEADSELKRIRLDTYIGMFFSNSVAWFIILAAAVTLHASGSTDINSAEQAANALKPVAGQFAFILFAVGIIGTGLLAVPILAGSAAFGVGEMMGQRVGIDFPVRKAPAFYFVFGLVTLVGLSMNFMPINPIKALVLSAIINGVVSVPVMIAMMLMVRNKQIMGQIANRAHALYWFGWLATAVMLVASVGMFLTMGH